jgi:hypothetical protein
MVLQPRRICPMASVKQIRIDKHAIAKLKEFIDLWIKEYAQHSTTQHQKMIERHRQKENPNTLNKHMHRYRIHG